MSSYILSQAPKTHPDRAYIQHTHSMAQTVSAHVMENDLARPEPRPKNIPTGYKYIAYTQHALKPYGGDVSLHIEDPRARMAH